MKKRSTRSGSCHALGPCGLGWGTRNNEDSHTVSGNTSQMFPINSPVSDKVSYDTMNKNMLDKITIHSWLAFQSSLLIFLSFNPLQCCMCGKTGWTKHLCEPSPGSGWGCIHTPDVCSGRGTCRGYNMWQLRETAFFPFVEFKCFCKAVMFVLCGPSAAVRFVLLSFIFVTFIQSNFQCITYKIYIWSVCVFPGLEPMPFALLTHSDTTRSQF